MFSSTPRECFIVQSIPTSYFSAINNPTPYVLVQKLSFLLYECPRQRRRVSGWSRGGLVVRGGASWLFLIFISQQKIVFGLFYQSIDHSLCIWPSTIQMLRSIYELQSLLSIIHVNQLYLFSSYTRLYAFFPARWMLCLHTLKTHLYTAQNTNWHRKADTWQRSHEQLFFLP